MVVTIADRSVAFIPIELESTLRLEPYCVACKAKDKPLRTCSSCKLVSYCCKECQATDWERHKVEDNCGAIKKERRRLDRAAETIRANEPSILTEAIARFGEDVYLGRRIAPGVIPGEDALFKMLAGRFSSFPHTREYMQIMTSLFQMVHQVCRRHNTRVMWEQALEIVMEMKRLIHVSDSGLFDREILQILLKLHRNEDCISMMHYLATRVENIASGGPRREEVIIRSSKGEYPFPCNQIAQSVDLSKQIERCDFFIGGTSYFPPSVVVIPLAVKLREVCTYRILSQCEDAFRKSELGQRLPIDVVKNIVSFVTGGKDASRRFARNWDHANGLLNYIDREFPHVLPGVLDPSVLQAKHFDERGIIVNHNQSFPLRGYFESYEGSLPVLEMLTDMLKLRYCYSERDIPEEEQHEYSWDKTWGKVAHS